MKKWDSAMIISQQSNLREREGWSTIFTSVFTSRLRCLKSYKSSQYPNSFNHQSCWGLTFQLSFRVWFFGISVIKGRLVVCNEHPFNRTNVVEELLLTHILNVMKLHCFLNLTEEITKTVRWRKEMCFSLLYPRWSGRVWS